MESVWFQTLERSGRLSLGQAFSSLTRSFRTLWREWCWPMTEPEHRLASIKEIRHRDAWRRHMSFRVNNSPLSHSTMCVHLFAWHAELERLSWKPRASCQFMQLWHLKHAFLSDGESLMLLKKYFVAMRAFVFGGYLWLWRVQSLHSRSKEVSSSFSAGGHVEIYSEIDHDDITSREVECFFDGRQLDRLSWKPRPSRAYNSKNFSTAISNPWRATANCQHE